MAEKPIFLTQEGKAKLESELATLVNEKRPEIAEQIRQAKEAGDISENAAFEDAKHQQGMIEGRIQELEYMLKHAQMIDEGAHAASEGVQMGCKVTVLDADGHEQRYFLVGSAEAKPGEGRISNESPLGKALLGHRIGDAVEVAAPSGKLTYTVKAIE
ncbi:MAG TPA: transcription elongation factor GreA [Chloroflexota bacterium]|nr:transcription elongation factor GreA [Chloroflexota bacterium]